ESEVRVHVAELTVADRAERLEDGSVEDVRADRCLRIEPEDEDQHRGHQAAAAHPGHADEEPDEGAGEDELPGQRASTTIPAPTVSFVASSMRMQAPVSRFLAYGSTTRGSARRKRTSPRSFRSILPGA